MGRKRSRDEESFSVAPAVAKLDGEAESKARGHTENGDPGGDWKVVKRRKKDNHHKEAKGSYPSIYHSPHARLQSFVKLGDIQNLILYLLADGNAPQWVSIKHHNAVQKVVVLMVPGLEAGLFDGSISLSSSTEERAPGSQPERNGDNTVPESLYIASSGPDVYYPTKLKADRLPEPLQPLSDIFEHIWPIRTPGEDKYARMHSPLASILTAPILKTMEDKNRTGSGPQPPREGRSWKNQCTPVTELVATPGELADEGYVLHPVAAGEAEQKRREVNGWAASDGWVDTSSTVSSDAAKESGESNEEGSVTDGRKVLALDCEMCITSPKGVIPQVFSLTRASLIGWNGEVVMDELVKPDDPITDYLTPYSGITAAMLENVTTTLFDVQQKLVELITPDTILVGHSLDSDLKALKLTHPFVVDTALLFPHPRGPPLKSSLKWLAQKYLSREIQKGHGSVGHDSIEDARACLDLVKQKCEKGKAWGTPEASAESLFKRLGRSKRPKKDKGHADQWRQGAVVDWGEPSRGYGGQAAVAIGAESDAEIVEGVKRAISEDSVAKGVPTGGCDLVWARMRELEAHRGWWDRSKLVDSDALRSATKDNVATRGLSDALAQTVGHISDIYEALPPYTAFIVYSGSGDPRELREMQALEQQFKQEYKVKKWDELSVKWTDVEQQRLRKACEKARKGVGFMTIK